MARFLVIADTPWVRNDVEASLVDPGTTVQVEEDPRRAVEVAAEGFDAVMVDLQVGSMGGIAVTRAIEDAIAAGEIPQTPVVVLVDRSADRFLVNRAGADAHVVKPFTPRALRDALAAGASRSE